MMNENGSGDRLDGRFNEAAIDRVLRLKNEKKGKRVKPPWALIFPPFKVCLHYPLRPIWWLSSAVIDGALSFKPNQGEELVTGESRNSTCPTPTTSEEASRVDPNVQSQSLGKASIPLPLLSTENRSD